MDQERLGQTNDILRRVALALEKLAPNQQTTQQAIDALLRIGITDSGKKADDPSKGSGDSKGGGRSRDRVDSGGDGGDSGGGRGAPKVPDQSPTGMLRGLGPSASRLFGAGESLLPGFGLGEIGGTISKMVNLLSAFDGAKDALGRMGFLGDASQKLGPPGLPPPIPPDVRTLPLSPGGPEKKEPGLLPLGSLPTAVVPGTEADEKLEPSGPIPKLLPPGAGTPRAKKPTLLGRDETVDPVPSLIPLDQQEGVPALQPLNGNVETVPMKAPGLQPLNGNVETVPMKAPGLQGPLLPTKPVGDVDRDEVAVAVGDHGDAMVRVLKKAQALKDLIASNKKQVEELRGMLGGTSEGTGGLSPEPEMVPALKPLAPRTQLAPPVFHDAASEGGDDIPMLNPQSPESGVEPPSTQIGAVGGDGEELPPADDGQADGPAVSELKNIGSTMKKIEEKTKPQADPQAKSRTHLGKSQSGEASGATTAHKDRGDVYGATIGQIEDRLAKVAEVALKVV